MTETIPNTTARRKPIVALLCVSDVAGLDGEAPLALTSLYGRPFLHHLIKSLENLGVSRFFIGIDAIPGALLSYGDMAKNDGLDIRFVRNPSDLARQVGEDDLILVQSADTIWEQSLVSHAIAGQKPLVATVEEQTENQRFERIDLNSRWGGLAILERQSLSMLTALPDGWDMGSALLRQALQDGVACWPVAQKNVQAGLVRKLSSAQELSSAMTTFASPDDNDPNSLEKMVFSPLLNRLLPRIWFTSSSRSAVEWLFPAVAGLSAVMSVVSMPIAAAILAMFAILAASIRKKAHILEYRSGRSDWLGRAGWALLAFALGAVLQGSEFSGADGIFVGLTILSISVFARNHRKAGGFWLSSPLMITIAALVGNVVGLTGWAIRLLILAEIGSLLWSQLQRNDSDKAAEDQA